MILNNVNLQRFLNRLSNQNITELKQILTGISDFYSHE